MSVGPESLRLDGRVALVTGAAQGLGRAVAAAFARCGADLALCDRDAEGLAATAREAEALGRRVVTGVLDVRERELVAAFCRGAGETFGRVDVLVNNAGGGFAAPFLEVSDKGQEALVRENFGSVGHLVREVVPLVPQAGGAIINVTSIEAHRAGPGYAVYSAMKAAVASLTRSLALELGDRGIRVNCIAPDMIPTPGLGKIEPNTPLLRAGCADDVAGAALFLASDLSAFVTGTTIHVDGGGWAAAGWRRAQGGGFEL